jgi:hypothetical protein
MRFTNAEGAGGQYEDKNMFNRIDTGTLKRGLLLFWALWLAVVVTTNVLDALQALGILPESFKFVSGNWQWINQTMDPLGVPRAVQAFLFAGVIAWEGLAAILFGWAFTSYRNRPLIQETATIWACGVNLALWAAFQVLDEVFLAYQPEDVHRGIFGNQILTLLMLYLLPTRDP